MPTQVYLEESIDQVISHTGYHLQNNIYPEFDPVYRIENKGVLIGRLHVLNLEQVGGEAKYPNTCTWAIVHVGYKV